MGEKASKYRRKITKERVDAAGSVFKAVEDAWRDFAWSKGRAAMKEGTPHREECWELYRRFVQPAEEAYLKIDDEYKIAHGISTEKEIEELNKIRAETTREHV